jgi:hypothetical protein
VDEPPVEQSPTQEETSEIAGRMGRGTVVGCAGLIVGVLILLLFITYVVTWFQKPSLKIVGSIERWLSFVANLVVACYCFPAFRATRQRPFLYLAFAASCFAYDNLFRLLFGPRLPTGLPPSQVLLYYGAQHFVEIAGLVLYASGIVSLARDARRRIK